MTRAAPAVAGPAYRVDTARLTLRPYQPDDAAAVAGAIAASRAELAPWIELPEPDESFELMLARMRALRGRFDLGQQLSYAIVHRDSDTFVGSGELLDVVGPGALALGCWIHSGHAGRGYATEAAAALVRVAVEVEHVDRVEIRCHPDNSAPAAVATRLGFHHEATLPRRELLAGELRDQHVFALYRDAYPTSFAATTLVRATDALGRPLISDPR